ncbi:hypothetical protein SELMODRAFT_180991 [Selaginella moellendorffii]|uniref:Uncharacterized protein n=1 Tax=Selaginella moellendorffii TaxID=88036 RepID=D8SM75_SELML|nr:hypothetical protein SELMODRAFT_180991 [Selaginella moellendorffii]
MAPYLCIVSFLLLLSCSSALAKNYDVSAVFVFGDSLVDSGNNNNLQSLAKANFLPYGKDFDTHKPTGRFANGRLVPDFIASRLGLDLAPAYVSANDNVLQGVNFASAGSGLLESTGLVFVRHFSLPAQVDHFQNVLGNNITAKLGSKRARELSSQAIYYITVGSNDLVNNYYLLPASPLAVQYTPERFQSLLLAEYHKQLQRLHGSGGRKFVLASLTALGCSPINLLRYNVAKRGKCVDFLNDAAARFNADLKASVVKWSSSLPGSHIVFANSFDYVLDLVRNPAAHGYKVGDQACCSGIGKNGAIVFCLRNVTTCDDTSSYVYWDEFHPSSRVYGELADRFWEGSVEDSYPINVKQLSTL